MKVARISVQDWRLEAVSPLARLLHYEATLYCARLETNGELHAEPLRKLGGRPALVSELVKQGLWSLLEDGSVLVNEFLKHNPASSQAEAARNAARERQFRHRHAHGNTTCHAVTDAVIDDVISSEQNANFDNSPSDSPSISSGSDPSGSGNSESSLPNSSDLKILTGSARDSEKPARRARKVALPESWKPSETHVEKARTLGVDLAREAERFRNNALGKDVRWVDWDRAFSNWLSSPYTASSGAQARVPARQDAEALRIEANARHDHLEWLRSEAVAGNFGQKVKERADAGSLNLDHLATWYEQQRGRRSVG